jgi:hypothetical protein
MTLFDERCQVRWGVGHNAEALRRVIGEERSWEQCPSHATRTATDSTGTVLLCDFHGVYLEGHDIDVNVLRGGWVG